MWLERLSSLPESGLEPTFQILIDPPFVHQSSTLARNELVFNHVFWWYLEGPGS